MASEIVTLQENEPTLEGASTVMVLVTELPGLTLTLLFGLLIWHQPWLVEPDHFKVVPPVLEMVRVWPAGVGPPEMPLKVKDVGEREI